MCTNLHKLLCVKEYVRIDSCISESHILANVFIEKILIIWKVYIQMKDGKPDDGQRAIRKVYLRLNSFKT